MGEVWWLTGWVDNKTQLVKAYMGIVIVSNWFFRKLHNRSKFSRSSILLEDEEGEKFVLVGYKFWVFLKESLKQEAL